MAPAIGQLALNNGSCGSISKDWVALPPQNTQVPRSTVQYRRTSSFELLKRYLEERADEWDEL